MMSQQKHVVDPPTAEQAYANTENSAFLLNEEIEKIGYKQNGDKRKVVPSLGQQENKKLADMMKRDAACKALPTARYLGGRHSYNQSNSEMKPRVNAMRKGWSEMGNMWRSDTSYNFKRGIFLSKV